MRDDSLWEFEGLYSVIRFEKPFGDYTPLFVLKNHLGLILRYSF